MTATLECHEQCIKFLEKDRPISLVLPQLPINSTHHDLPDTLHTRWIALHIMESAALQPGGREPFFHDQPLCYAASAPDYRT